MNQMRHNGNTRSRNYVWWNPLRYPPLAAPQSEQAVISSNSELTEITNDETPDQPIVRQNRQGHWMGWSAWSDCQGECGQDFQTRVRKCLGGLPGETCPGKRHDIRACLIPRRTACSYWSGWSEWSSPSKTCGDSKRCKSRTCIGQKAGFEKCIGEPEICEEVVNEDPSKIIVCDEPEKKCCPPDEPHCCSQQCFESDACSGAKSLGVLPCSDIVLPCCSEWSDWTNLCVQGKLMKHRFDLCDSNKYENVELDAQWSEWVLRHPCSGSVIEGHGHCPGIEVYERTHVCFSAQMKSDSEGNPLQQFNSRECGSKKLIWTEWSGSCPQCADGSKQRRQRVDQCSSIEGESEEKDCPSIPLGAGVWSEWTNWVGCPTSYPDACGDTRKERKRGSDCGIVSDGEVVYTELDVTDCPRPPIQNWSSWTVCPECTGQKTLQYRSSIDPPCPDGEPVIQQRECEC